MDAPHVWRLGQLSDLREAGDMVLIQRGDERVWLDLPLATAVGIVAERMTARTPEERASAALQGFVVFSIAMLVIGFLLF